MSKYLIFIDTNIFLDFYRVRGRESSLSILKHIDQHPDRFITTYQVEMEFKKNRQKVLVDSHASLKVPDLGGLNLPAFLADTKQSGALERSIGGVKKHSTTLKNRLTKMLNNPTTEDKVYQTAQRLFRADASCHLMRDDKRRRAIRHGARTRFMLGYPPRKKDNLSIGDAINWEWIVECAKVSGHHIVIVSRDSDYGVGFAKDMILNDWLRQEFKERVSKKRKIVLTDRLSEGLKLASIAVTKQEAKAEEELIVQRQESTARSAEGFWSALAGGAFAANAFAATAFDTGARGKLDPLVEALMKKAIEPESSPSSPSEEPK